MIGPNVKGVGLFEFYALGREGTREQGLIGNLNFAKIGQFVPKSPIDCLKFPQLLSHFIPNHLGPLYKVHFGLKSGKELCLFCRKGENGTFPLGKDVLFLLRIRYFIP